MSIYPYKWIYIGVDNAVAFNTNDPPYMGYMANRLGKFAYYQYINPFGNLANALLLASNASTKMYTKGSEQSDYLVKNIDTAVSGIYISGYNLSYGGAQYSLEDLVVHSSASDAIAAVNDGNWDGPVITAPITYRLTNCTIPDAPNEAVIGSTVTITPVFTEGYGILESTDVYVTCNGVNVPSTYLNGVLSFTMPDPS